MSEAARLAYVQEKIKIVKRSERMSNLGVLFGAITVVVGLRIENRILQISGVAFIIIFTFAAGTYFMKLRAGLMEEFRQLTEASFKCPECGKPIPQADFAYCPYCAAPLKSWALQTKQ
jgi:hypothetical protein